MTNSAEWMNISRLMATCIINTCTFMIPHRGPILIILFEDTNEHIKNKNILVFTGCLKKKVPNTYLLNITLEGDHVLKIAQPYNCQNTYMPSFVCFCILN